MIDHYREVASPAAIRSASLRYINRIDTPGVAPVISDYFSFSPNFPSLAGTEPQSILVGTEFRYEDNDALVVQLVTVEPDEPETTAFVLDLSHSTRDDGPIELAQAVAWLDRAHERLGIAFEQIITDHLRIGMMQGGA